MDYSIAAIPTVYRGRRYRSRLEARWAAFFDRLGLIHEYEPYDLGRWSPDFLIRGQSGRSVLVEVKPIIEFDAGIAEKMVGAWRDRFGKAETAPSLLLAGISPSPSMQNTGWLRIGWCPQANGAGPMLVCEGIAGWSRGAANRIQFPDIMMLSQAGISGALTGTPYKATSARRTRPSMEHTSELWEMASNEVQWHKGGGR
jgi:hypothetical protein